MPKVVSISVYVHDLKAAIDFYTKHLDFVVKDTPTPDIVELEHDGPALVLCKAETQQRQAYATGTIVGVFTPNLSKSVARLRSAGADVLFEEAQQFPGGTFNAVRDPSGNVVELLTFG